MELRLGDIVPADLRLLEVTGLECDESAPNRESLPVDKSLAGGVGGRDLAGRIVRVRSHGHGRADGRCPRVVVATGAHTEFGKIAAGLDTHPLDTEFQVGLRRFSLLLVYVAARLRPRSS